MAKTASSEACEQFVTFVIRPAIVILIGAACRHSGVGMGSTTGQPENTRPRSTHDIRPIPLWLAGDTTIDKDGQQSI
jgi:hypothetical protein